MNTFPSSPTDFTPQSPPRLPVTTHIGRPQTFLSGPHSGKTIRAELISVQDAELGRKCADPPKTSDANKGRTSAAHAQKVARKDRRPLDPPPVVRLRLLEILDVGMRTQREREIPAEEIEIFKLMCQAELLRYTPPGQAASSSSQVYPDPQLQQQYYPNQSPAPSTPSSGAFPPTSSNGTRSVSPSSSGTGTERDYEPSNVTHALFGNSFTNAANLKDPEGKSVIYFVFSDLAVKLEGYFVLRFRFFDLNSPLSQPLPSPIHSPPMLAADVSGPQQPQIAPQTPRIGNIMPILAECTSGPFCVYSTKEFPGLKASTELTKHLSRWGIRVNIRETERRRKNNPFTHGAMGLPGPGPSTMYNARKRKSGDEEDDSESEEEEY